MTPSSRITPFHIRPATLADAPAVGRVFDGAVAAAWTHLGGIERDPLFTLQEWRDLIAAHLEDDVVLGATDPGCAIVGFCAVHPGDGEMYLLFVDPAHAGQGVGRALLRAGHDRLRAAGCREAFLFTQATNDRAEAVYTAAGYRRDGQTRTSEYRGRSFLEVRMTVDLEQTR